MSSSYASMLTNTSISTSALALILFHASAPNFVVTRSTTALLTSPYMAPLHNDREHETAAADCCTWVQRSVARPTCRANAQIDRSRSACFSESKLPVGSDP